LLYLFRGVVAHPGLHAQVPGLRFQLDLVIAPWLGVGRDVADLVLQPHIVGDLRENQVERSLRPDRKDMAARGIGNIVQNLPAADLVGHLRVRHAVPKRVAAE